MPPVSGLVEAVKKRSETLGRLRNRERAYRVTSLTRNSAPLGPYSRNMPWGLWWSWGGELDRTSSAPRWKVSEREEPSPCEGPAPPQILPWGQPRGKKMVS